VVGTEPAVRTLPPAALDGMTVAKLGIIGRAPVDCELVAQLFDVSSGAPAAALTPPASVTLTPSDVIRTIWLDVPRHDPLQVPAAVSVRTNHGRFLWAANPEPLLRIAIDDPLPGGRPARIGGHEIAAPTAPETHVASSSPDAAALLKPIADAAGSLLQHLDPSSLNLGDYAKHATEGLGIVIDVIKGLQNDPSQLGKLLPIGSLTGIAEQLVGGMGKSGS